MENDSNDNDNGNEYEPFTTYLSSTYETTLIANAIAESSPITPAGAYQEIVNRIRSDIENRPERKNRFNHPNKTLADGYGDCDDQAVLACSIADALPDNLRPTEIKLIIGFVVTESTEMLRTFFGRFPYKVLRQMPHAWALVTPPTTDTNQDTRSRILDSPNGLCILENPSYIVHTEIVTDGIIMYA